MLDLTLALIALAAMMGLPLGCGLAAAELARRRVGRQGMRRAGVAVAVVLLVLAPWLIGPRVLAINLYDACLVTFLLALGLASGWPQERVRLDARGVVVSAFVGLASLGALEVFLRVQSAAQARAGQAAGQAAGQSGARGGAQATTLFASEQDRLVDGCAAMYPQTQESGWFSNYHGPGQRERTRMKRRYLHVGDSMVEGKQVGEAELFTSLLERARPGEEHLNLGISSVGPDVYYVVLASWLERLRPDAIVVHVFPGNDLEDIDRPRACCDGGALLTSDASPQLRCPQPRWKFTLDQALTRARAPYPIRMLGGHSELARRVVVAFDQAAIRGQRRQPRIERFEAVNRAIVELAAAHHVPVRFVLVPIKHEMLGSTTHYQQGIARRGEMLAALGRTGARVDDASPAFASARDLPSLFQAGDSDPHFSPAGHAHYARLLRELIDRGPRSP